MGGKISGSWMQRVQIKQILTSGLLIIACCCKDVKQLRIHRVEMLAQLRMAFLVNDIKLTRHDLKSRHRLHIVFHSVIATICLFQLFRVYSIKGRRMWDEENVRITVLIHKFLCHLLQLLEHRNSNGVGHYISKLIPNDEQTIVSPKFCKTVLYLSKPLLYIVVIKTDIELSLAQRVAYAMENAKIACRQTFYQLIAVGYYRRKGSMCFYQMIPYLRILTDLLNIIFIIRRHGYIYLVLVERFRYCFLKHKS